MSFFFFFMTIVYQTDLSAAWTLWGKESLKLKRFSSLYIYITTLIYENFIS